MAAQRETAAAHDEHEQDEQEGHRALDARQVADAEEVLHVEPVAHHPRLADADDETAEQGERERPEAAEQRGGHRGDGDDEREGDRRQAGERRDQHGGEAGQAGADSPGECRELVGDQPRVCTARSFWAAALIASPTRVYRASAHSAAVITHVMPMM